MKNKTEQVNTAIVLKSLEKQAKPILNKLAKIEAIKTQEQYDAAGKLVKSLKELGKIGDKEMRKITDPLNDALKATRKHFKPFMDTVAEKEKITKDLMLQFVEQQKKLSAKVDEDFEGGKIKKVSTYADKKAAAEIKNSSAQVRKFWTVEITDIGSIPREYLMPDIAAITEAFKSGKKVKGCAYVQKETIAI